MLQENISVIPNSCVAWSAEEFAARFPTAVLHGLQKSFPPDSQTFVPNSLARNAADLLPCLSDGFGFLLLDGETDVHRVRCFRNRSIIND